MANECYIDASVIDPNLAADLIKLGFIPGKGKPFSVGQSFYEAVYHNGEDPLLCIVPTTIKESTISNKLAYDTLPTIVSGDKVLRAVCLYSAKRMERMAVVYPNNRIVDLTPYIPDVKPGAEWFYDPFNTGSPERRLCAALDMLYIYGPDKYSSIMTDEKAIKLYMNILTSTDLPDDWRNSFMGVLSAVKPTIPELYAFLDVFAEKDTPRATSLSRWMLDAGKITDHPAIMRGVFDFVVKNGRGPLCLDEVMHGRPMGLRIPQLKMTLTLGEEIVLDDKKVSFCSVRMFDNSAVMEIEPRDRRPAEKDDADDDEEENRIARVYTTLSNPSNNCVDGVLDCVPSCVKTVDDLYHYTMTVNGERRWLTALIQRIAAMTPDMRYHDLSNVIKIGKKFSTEYPVSDAKIVYAPQHNILRVGFVLEGNARKSGSIPVGIPARALIGFLTTYGFSADVRAARSAYASMMRDQMER